MADDFYQLIINKEKEFADLWGRDRAWTNCSGIKGEEIVREIGIN